MLQKNQLTVLVNRIIQNYLLFTHEPTLSEQRANDILVIIIYIIKGYNKKIMVRFTDKERNSVPEIVEDVINLLIKKKVISDEEINDIIRKYQQ